MEIRPEEKSFSELQEALQKARPALPIGTIRIWGGQKYVKHADGWIAVGGNHHGKRLGAFGREPTHATFADEHDETKKKPPKGKKSTGELTPEERKRKIEENERRIQELEAKLREHAEKKKEPESPKPLHPEFKSYAEAVAWMKEAAKKYQTKDDFLSSPEYKAAYSEIHSLHEKEKAESQEKQPEPRDASIDESEEKPSESSQSAEPLASDDPRAAAEKQEKDEKDSEYEFARRSEFGNKGEDLKNSARHRRNEWRGLEQAEKDGTAKELVRRDVLMKQDPVDYLSEVSEKNYLGPMAAYLALKKFPTEPKVATDHFRRNSDEDVVKRKWKNKRSGEVYSTFTSSRPYPETDWEMIGEIKKKDIGREHRAEYVEAFDRLKKKSAELMKETNPMKVIEGMRAECGKIIEELRKRDRYSAMGNGLVNYYNKMLSPTPYRAAKSGVLMELGAFQHLARDKYGDRPNETHTEELAEHARSVIEGASIDKAFGKASKDRGFNAAEAYVTHAERKGPEEPGLDTKEAQEKALIQTMKMRGLQWGNSVSDEERKHHLKQAALAFADLADILELPKEMGSFNGRLGLAIGARGHGSALAHYEPSSRVINLTRKGGVGSLAHEWGHFFDNILNELHGGGKSGFLTNMAEARGRSGAEQSPTQQAMAALVSSPVFKRFRSRIRETKSYEIMSQGQRTYWTSTIEMFARSFEKYVAHKLEQKSRKNTYLSGVKPHALWPLDDEVQEMVPFFDKILESFRSSDLLKKALELVEALRKGTGEEPQNPSPV